MTAVRELPLHELTSHTGKMFSEELHGTPRTAATTTSQPWVVHHVRLQLEFWLPPRFRGTCILCQGLGHPDELRWDLLPLAPRGNNIGLPEAPEIRNHVAPLPRLPNAKKTEFVAPEIGNHPLFESLSAAVDFYGLRVRLAQTRKSANTGA
jgi:hypothetical protein